MTLKRFSKRSGRTPDWTPPLPRFVILSAVEGSIPHWRYE